MSINDEEKRASGFVTMSQKGAPQLYYLGYFFRLKNPKQDLNLLKSYSWRCTYQSCNVTCETMGCSIGSNFDVTSIKGEHVEAINTKKLAKLEYLRKIKEIATISCEYPRKIVTKVQRNSVDQRKLLKLPQVLAFVPVENVIFHFKEIIEKFDGNDEKILKFYQYLKETYTGGKKLVKSSGRRNAKLVEK